MAEKKKRSSRNLKINTRIVLTSVLTIIVPILLIATFSGIFINTIASYFDFSSVTTNNYSTVNQIQWNQTLSSISDELLSSDSTEKKLAKVKKFITPLEKINSSIYISQNGNTFYATESAGSVMKKAKDIFDSDMSKNTFYFGENGLVIVNNTGKDTIYKIVIVNDDYSVKNASERFNAKALSSVLAGKTGLIVLIIVLIFVVAIAILSFITSTTILRPIKKIAKGADEIACGNLDYVIDYDSTNELGQTVNSFNAMRLRLKESIESRQQAEMAKKEMTAGLAHDLRTPLTSIKGYVEGLIDGIANTPEKQQQYLKTIYDSTCQTEKMLNELLMLSKLELGGASASRSVVNVNEFLNDASNWLKEYLLQQNFDFIFKNNCSNQAEIEIDTDGFQRVFMNIVNNSVKYANKDIKGIVKLIATEYDKFIILEFEDNGIGVDKENLPKIFDTMYRTDPARSKVSQGSGLGLAVCKQIIEQNLGSVWARSHENNGLSIFISLEKRVKENEKDFDN